MPDPCTCTTSRRCRKLLLSGKVRVSRILFDEDTVTTCKGFAMPKYFGDSNSRLADVLYYRLLPGTVAVSVAASGSGTRELRGPNSRRRRRRRRGPYSDSAARVETERCPRIPLRHHSQPLNPLLRWVPCQPTIAAVTRAHGHRPHKRRRHHALEVIAGSRLLRTKACGYPHATYYVDRKPCTIHT